MVKPQPFDSIVPRVLPGQARTYTLVSGVMEMALAAGIAVPASRRAAGKLAAVFLAGVWPANIKMAIDSRDAAAPRPLLTGLRVPLQIPMIRSVRRLGDTG